MIGGHPDTGQAAGYALSRMLRRAEDVNRRPPARETTSVLLPDRSNHRSLEMLAVWGYVVFSFAALLFCTYVICVKCHTSSPF